MKKQLLALVVMLAGLLAFNVAVAQSEGAEGQTEQKQAAPMMPGYGQGMMPPPPRMGMGPGYGRGFGGPGFPHPGMGMGRGMGPGMGRGMGPGMGFQRPMMPQGVPNVPPMQSGGDMQMPQVPQMPEGFEPQFQPDMDVDQLRAMIDEEMGALQETMDKQLKAMESVLSARQSRRDMANRYEQRLMEKARQDYQAMLEEMEKKSQEYVEKYSEMAKKADEDAKKAESEADASDEDNAADTGGY